MEPLSSIRRVVREEVMPLYAQSHPLTLEQAIEAEADFTAFFVAAITSGCRGIRWSFSGCLLCDPPRRVDCLCRVMVNDDEIRRHTDGRALGGELCHVHEERL